MTEDNDLTGLLAEYADSDGEMAGKGDLAAISALANQQLDLERQIEQATLALSLLGEQLREISQEKLPDAMDAAGVKDFTLSDGSKITVKPDVQTSIIADLKREAYAWLHKNGHGSIIKHDVSVSFKRDESELAEAAVDALREAGFEPTDKEDVHYQTLQAWGRAEAIEGNRPPKEFFNTFELNIAKIKAPKK